MKEINGDKQLSIKNKFCYLFYNLIRGIAGYVYWIRSKYWNSKKIEDGKASPGRKYLNQFLLQEIPNII